jgi:TrmH family RNA methyltransferase
MQTLRLYSKGVEYQKLEVLKTNRRKRFAYREFLVEGVRNINEAVKYGWKISSFVYSQAFPLSTWAKDKIFSVKTEMNYELPHELLRELSGKSDVSELMAVVEMRVNDLSAFRLSTNPLLALFDSPSNHGNLGSIIRSCDALGVEGLFVTGHSVDPYDPEVVGATMGSFFKVPFLRLATNEQWQTYSTSLKDTFPGFQTVGTTSHQQTRIYDVDFLKPTLVAIGNETIGLSRGLRDSCDVLATIPMSESSSASSLNVASAATVMFYEASRQRAVAAPM